MFQTRKHSSRRRTARFSGSDGGDSLPNRPPPREADTLSRGRPLNGQTNTRKDITFPQSSGGNKNLSSLIKPDDQTKFKFGRRNHLKLNFLNLLRAILNHLNTLDNDPRHQMNETYGSNLIEIMFITINCWSSIQMTKP